VVLPTTEMIEPFYDLSSNVSI
jgi:hypothetical protein